jgi:ParB-like chromosome segregation protein Spo0J
MKPKSSLKTLVPLEAIVPNPSQPRRAIPVPLARALRQGKLTLMQVYQKVFGASNPTPHVTRLKQEIEGLAKSIAEEMAARPETHGVINPLTVNAIDKGRYMVETGEMRLWAMVALALAYPDNERYRSVPVQVITHPSAVRQAVENLQRHSLNAMEMAWSLQLVWTELKRERPLELVPLGGKKSRGRPREWPTWGAVAERVGLSDSAVALYTPLLTLPAEAQAMIHAFDIPETRLRYLLAHLPRPKYNKAIARLIKQATTAEWLWSSSEFRQAVEAILGQGATKKERGSVARLAKDVTRTRATLNRAAQQFQDLLGKRPSIAGAQRQQTRLAKAEMDTDFRALVGDAKILIRYLQTLVAAAK